MQENIFTFMWTLQKLKEYKRWWETKTMTQKESIADHIWKVLVIVFVVYKNIDIKLDFLRVIKLVLVHDLAEAITEDIDYNLVYSWEITSKQKYKEELNAIRKIVEVLWWDIWNEIFELWNEYEKWESSEVKFVKALEKIDPIDHVIFYWHKFIDIPDKFATYNDKSMSMVPELKWFFHWYKIKLKETFSDWNFEWKDSYNTKWSYEEFKNFEKIFQFIQIAQKLKEARRYETAEKDGIKETVAEHSFRLTFFVWIATHDLDLKIDIQKALEIAIFHDIIESLAWDTDYKLVYSWKISAEEKNKKEILAMEKIRETLPKKIWNEIYKLWDEYEKSETKESKVVKALDKIEAIDHFIRHGIDYIDDPKRIAWYLNSSVKICSDINPIHELYRNKLRKLYVEWWIEWKEEYEA